MSGTLCAMDISASLEALDLEGRLLASAAEAAGTDAPVPACPGWSVRDLVRHTGTVHRWAGAFVAEGVTAPRRAADEPALDGTELLDWFREGHRRLVGTLAGAPKDVRCWAFLPAPSPLAFWARRQLHETTVHRLDAEAARGGAPTAIDRDVAVDGIDELLAGFHARDRSRVRTERPRVLRVRATDAAAVWTIRLSDGPPVTVRDDEQGVADCEFAGPAAELYAGLWNRAPLAVTAGDAALARLWREHSGITWN